MAVTRQKKEETISKLKEMVREAQSIGFAKSNAVTVEEFDGLRESLRKEEAGYMIAKKTLIKIAIKEELGIDLDLADLPGQIGIVCSTKDTVSGLSKVNDFVKATEKKQKMEWAGVIVDGEFKWAEDAKLLASMPNRETLLGRLVGSMKSPLSAFARFIDAAAKEVEAQGKENLGQIDVKKEENTESEGEDIAEEK